MQPLFQSQTRAMSFADPFNDFKPARREVELRTCPLSGDRARVLTFRSRELPPIDHADSLAKGPAATCPFCPGNLEKMAARFLEPAAPDGLMAKGEATAFPNAFPYESFSAVVVLGKEHYRTPAGFDQQVLSDALGLAADCFRLLTPKAAYASVNWNYMMPAGAGLVHPHLQLAAAPSPTAFQRTLKRRAAGFARGGGGSLAAAYIEAEKKNKLRFLGRTGPVYWLTPFAPRAIFDVMALCPEEKGLTDLTAGQIKALARGVTRVLKYFEDKGVDSYNLALHTTLDKGKGLPFMLRLVSRINLPPMGTNEINYFNKLHDEHLTFLPPESLAGELRPYFK